MTTEKPLSEKEKIMRKVVIAFQKGYDCAREEEAKRVERLKEKFYKIECENVVDGICDEIFGDLK